MVGVILSVIAVIISIISLISTLRKKEFGEFLFVQKEGVEIWIRLIKSDVFDVEFEFINNIKPSRIKILYPNESKDIPLWFDSSPFSKFNHSLFSDNSIIKINFHSDLKIKISYNDRFNNRYCQIVEPNQISKRKHINFWKLTFGG
jgi:hypothetical protein